MGRLMGLLAVLVAACTPNAATLTLINHTTKAIKVTVDELPSTVRASGFVNLASLKPGRHFVKIDNAPTQPLMVTPRRTTVLDLAGDGCYIVADFTPQYENQSGDLVIVEERFKKQPLFTTREALTVPYGDALPRKVDVGTKVRRLHAIDCSMIEVDRAILETVSRLP